MFFCFTMYLIQASHLSGAANSAVGADLAVKAHVDYQASYQVDYNFLWKTHQQSLRNGSSGLTGLFGNNTNNVFPPASDSSVSDSGDVKDLKSAFERIYEAAKREYVSDAFSCLLKLKEIPYCLCLSVFSEDAWGKIVPFLEAKNYSVICERVADLSAMYSPQKRQEFLSFLYAFAGSNRGNNN